MASKVLAIVKKDIIKSKRFWARIREYKKNSIKAYSPLFKDHKIVCE
jgi:hypothetical protein